MSRQNEEPSPENVPCVIESGWQSIACEQHPLRNLHGLVINEASGTYAMFAEMSAIDADNRTIVLGNPEFATAIAIAEVEAAAAQFSNLPRFRSTKKALTYAGALFD